jgi:hypothetical protein
MKYSMKFHAKFHERIFINLSFMKFHEISWIHEIQFRQGILGYIISCLFI